MKSFNLRAIDPFHPRPSNRPTFLPKGCTISCLMASASLRSTAPPCFGTLYSAATPASTLQRRASYSARSLSLDADAVNPPERFARCAVLPPPKLPECEDKPACLRADAPAAALCSVVQECLQAPAQMVKDHVTCLYILTAATP